MATEIRCPDCGGVIGSTDPSAKRCTCLGVDEPSSNDSTVGMSRPAETKKVCCSCGKDLAGHRRYKDSIGYWCVSCHRADRVVNTPEGERCGDCGRTFAPEKLNDYAGDLRLCNTCLKERRSIAKKPKRYHKVDSTYHALMERRQLVVLLLIFIVLLVLAILGHYGVIGG